MTTPEELAKQLPIKQIYEDVLQQSAKEIGQGLADVIKAAKWLLAPIELAATLREEKWLRYLEKIKGKVPEENRIEVPPHISVPIILGLDLQPEDSLLTEYFINLLSRAMDKERCRESHPAFTGFVKNISPDEATIIFYLKQKKWIITRRRDLIKRKGVEMLGRPKTIYNEFPADKLIYAEHFEMYMHHLNQLGLVALSYVDEKPVYDKSMKQIATDMTDENRLNDLGELFAKACCPDDIEQWSHPEK